MVKSTAVWALSIVPGFVPWLRTFGTLGAWPATVVLVEVELVVAVEVARRLRRLGAGRCLVVGRGLRCRVPVVELAVVCRAAERSGATEKQAQSSPARCSRCTALSKVSPVTSGTIVPWG